MSNNNTNIYEQICNNLKNQQPDDNKEQKITLFEQQEEEEVLSLSSIEDIAKNLFLNYNTKNTTTSSNSDANEELVFDNFLNNEQVFENLINPLIIKYDSEPEIEIYHEIPQKSSFLKKSLNLQKLNLFGGSGSSGVTNNNSNYQHHSQKEVIFKKNRLSATLIKPKMYYSENTSCSSSSSSSSYISCNSDCSKCSKCSKK